MPRARSLVEKPAAAGRPASRKMMVMTAEGATENPARRERSLPRVVVVGNLTVDDVVHPDGRTSMGSLGGNSVYASVAAAIWGVPVGVVARFGEDFPPAALERLRAAGIDTGGLRPIKGATVRNWVLYEDDGRRSWVYRTPPMRSLEVAPAPEDLPPTWLDQADPPVVHIASMPLTAAARLVEYLRHLPRRAILTLDTHEEWSADRGDLLAVARRVDVFLPSREELRTLLGYDDPERACEELLVEGVPAVVVKCGAAGALLASSTGLRAQIAAPKVDVVDVTGAGDSFCGRARRRLGARRGHRSGSTPGCGHFRCRPRGKWVAATPRRSPGVRLSAAGPGPRRGGAAQRRQRHPAPTTTGST